MNADDFEKRLQRQAMRQIPRAWRGEILTAARRAGVPRPSTANSQPAPWWRDLLWPCPQAWAGLAAVWMVILFLNVLSPGPVDLPGPPRTSAGRATLMAFKERQRMLAEIARGAE